MTRCRAERTATERETRGTARGRADLRPAAGVRGQANADDPAIYEEAERDPRAGGSAGREKLDWAEPWNEVLEWNPPWAKWFVGGKLNVSHNCLDRHVDAGLGDRVAYHWEGEDGERRDDHLRRPARDDEAVRERAEEPGCGA